MWQYILNDPRQETHTQTNRARRHRQEVNLTQ